MKRTLLAKSVMIHGFGGCMAFLVACGIPAVASAQTRTLRVVTYNINADQGEDGAQYTLPQPGLITPYNSTIPYTSANLTSGGVLEAIGEEIVNGDPAQPIDILALQETTSNTTTVQPIVDGLNAFYVYYANPAGYAMSTYQALNCCGSPEDGGGPNAMVYNTNTLQLIASVPVDPPGGIGNLGSISGMYREVVRYEFAPAGVTATTNNEFYIYVSHYKSGSGTKNDAYRLGEATIIRNDESINLPANARVLYVGDYNPDDNSSEPGYQTICSNSAPDGITQGQGLDPLNIAWNAYTSASSTINWSTNTTNANILFMLSESATNLDYRDDLQVMTSNVYSNVAGGLQYVQGTYHSFGNNASLPYGSSVTTNGNTALNDLDPVLTNRYQLSAAQTYTNLTYATDHLPVVADYTIPVPSAPTFTTSQNNGCYSQTNGSITVTAAGGSGSGYTYYLNSALQPSNVFTGLAAGVYTILVKDGYGDTSTGQVVTITQPSAVTFTTSQVNETCNGQSIGSITVTASGGNGSYTYSDNNGSSYQSGNTFSGLAAGSYTVVVKDGNGCLSSAAPVTITQPSVLSCLVSPLIVTNCTGSSQVFTVSASGGTAGYTYGWSGPGSFSATGSSVTNNNVQPASAGTYTVTVTDANGCESTCTATLTVNAVPGTPGAITQGNPTGSSVCTNASGVTYTISSVSGATSYTWSVPAGASITAGQGTTSITVTWGTTGGNVTVTANNSFCSGSAASLAVSLVSSAPVAPTASAGTSVTTSGFTANWGAATGATGYDLDVATDNGFTSFVTGYNNLDVGNVTSYAVTGLNGGTPYYYRVRAYNPCGTSNNSNTQTVTTLARTLTINLVVSNIVHHFTPAQSMPPLPGSVLDQLIYDKTGLTNVNLSSYNSFELRLFAPNGQGISVNRSTNYSSAVSIYYVAGADSSSHTEPATLSFENFSGSMPSNTYSLFYIGNAGNVLNFWGEENYTNAISFTAMKYSFTPAYNPTNTPKTFTSQSDLGYPVSFSYSTSQTNDPGPFVTMAFLLSTNSWIAGNGTWETGTNWSSGAAPSLADSADLITNAGNNTVTIDASTVLSNAFIGCLSISNLSIAGTANSTNTLFLNNAGTTTPLQVLGTVLTLETNGAVVVNNSAVLATESDSMIGKTGGGASLTITNGGAVYDLDGSLGYEAGSSNNTAVVTGVGSVWNNQTYLDVGSSGGSNLLNIAGGSVVATNVVISYGVSASNNVLLVTGGSLVVTNSLGTGLLVVSRVGGKGSLILNNGSVTANALIATNGANSVVTFNGGTLNSGGTFVTNSQVFAVGDSLDAATFHLNGGVHSFAGNLEIRNNATLTGCGTINGNVLVDTGGTVLANCGTLTFSGIVTNNGTMRAIEGSVLEAYGTVVNNGTIDIINGATNFHGGFINSNNGTVLTATSVQISKVSISGQDVVIQVPSVTGHTYQLQYTTSLTPANWTNTGAPQSGTGGALTFTDSDGAAYTQRFYRVDVTAP